MTIYEFEDYKSFLKQIINSSSRGMISRLAEAAGCQRSYLSQALSTQVNLTSDQVYNMSLFLQHDDNEQEFFILLLEKEKAATYAYKKRIEKKLSSLKSESNRISNKFKSTSKKEVPNKYYSAWYYSAVHIATSIETLKTEKDFSIFFGLSLNTIQEILNDLKSWELVLHQKGQWLYNESHSLHLKDDSLLNRLNHSNWRTFVLSKPLLPEQNVNYTSVFTVSKKDATQLKLKLLEFLKEQRSDISASSSEELMVFNCDLMSINLG